MEICNASDLNKCLMSPTLSAGEKSCLMWQAEQCAGFYAHLWKCISTADLQNLRNLEKGFPGEVAAYRDFAHTGALGRKVHEILTAKCPGN